MTWQPRGIEARVAVLGGQEQISKIHNKIHNKIHKLGGPAYIIYLLLTLVLPGKEDFCLVDCMVPGLVLVCAGARLLALGEIADRFIGRGNTFVYVVPVVSAG